MGGARKFSALMLALACAAVLAACGGSSSSTTSATSATTPPSKPEPGTTEGGGESSKGGESGSEAQPEEGSESSSEEGKVSPNDRSAQFRTKGGDNSIQNFGEEEGASERAEATRTITVFFSASKGKEYAKVCGVLSKKARAQVEEFSKQSPKLKGKSCAGVIELLLSSAPSSARPETIKGGVVSLRRKGTQSFALYHGKDGKAYAFPLVREAGQWKLIGMAPTPLSY